MTIIWQIWLAFGDAIALIASVFLTYILREHFTSNTISFIDLFVPFSVLFVVWITILFIFNLYNSESINPNPRNIGQLILAMAINGVIGISFFYIFPFFGITPKLSLLFIVVISSIFLVTWRRGFYIFGKRFFMKSVLLIGEKPVMEQFKKDVANQPYIREIHILEESHECEERIHTYTSGRTQSLIITENTHVLERIVPFAIENRSRITTLRQAYEDLLARIPTHLINKEYVAEIRMKKDTIAYAFTKNIIDKVLALAVLVMTSPIILITIVAIKFGTRGPVLIRQKRTGKNGKIFELYKFRSMFALAPDGSAEKEGVQWAHKNDDRITRVGHIIRALHIDEIPQMINIIRGDLALVGPRPERPEFVEKLNEQIPLFSVRQSIKPGFTGWAQIKFRYARTIEDSERKFEYDLYYIKNRNMLLDFGIILKTIQIIFTH